MTSQVAYNSYMGEIFSVLNRMVDTLLTDVDRYQRKHHTTAFLFAIFKKYNDDEAGHKAALLAYYGFLALFPLLLVLASIVTMLVQNNHQLGERVTAGAVTYFPVVGHDLQRSINGLHKSGVVLAAGILLTLFGARGIADVFRNSLDHLWHVPYVQRTSFPRSLFKSMALILVGGFGATLAPLVSSIVLAFGRGLVFRIIGVAFATLILFWTLIFMIKVGSSVSRQFGEIAAGALVATLSIEVLQSVGGFLMTRELQHLDSVYGTFAIVLGLIFWIYLQAQVLLYALEVDVVRDKRLWPRSLHGPLTPADHRAYELYSSRTIYHEGGVKPPPKAG